MTFPISEPGAALKAGLLDGRPSYTVLSAPRQIAAAIKREILEGILKPGDRLPSEERLAELFKVSRPTVRAALQELSSSGAVVVQRGRGGGYRVSAFSLDNLQTTVSEFIALSLVVEALRPAQFLEVRQELELLSAGAAATRRTSAQLEQLEEIEERIRHVIADPAAEDPRHAFELDLEFHRALAEAANNPLIISFEGSMTAVLHYLFGSGVSVPPEEALGELPDVIEMVRRQDAAGARAAMARHLEHSIAHLELRLPAEQARAAR
jgi:GntR family transcriptional regulator, transcriptional repressor for pyruvate dehydrogenase complex